MTEPTYSELWIKVMAWATAQGAKRNSNPFAGMNIEQAYSALIDGSVGPRWPDEKMQQGYTGTFGPDLLRRTNSFIDILDKDGAFKPNWKGLDYGCGWGRFASTLLAKGDPEQLDLCDAWAMTISILNDLNYQNYRFKVSELLKPGEIERDKYDFVLSFSVFTHLAQRAFEQNIPSLLESLKLGGKLYITVRHDEFIDHKYEDRASELRSILDRDDIVFLDSGGDLTGEKIFGDTIIKPIFLKNFGTVNYLGTPHTLQHVYTIRI